MSSRLETVAKFLAAIAALLTAGLGLWKLLPPPAPVPAPESQPNPSPPEPPPRFRKLLWGPSDCKLERPALAIERCSETRELEWLRGQLKFLRQARVAGFADLPGSVKLEAGPSGGNANWILYVRGGDDATTVGVGYDVGRDLKDGALRISARRSGSDRIEVVSPPVMLDERDEWWVRNGSEWSRVEVQ